MSKRDIIFLLMPSVFLSAIAAISLFYASNLLLKHTPPEEADKRVDELVRRTQAGEFGPDGVGLIDLLKDEWHRADVLHEGFAKSHTVSSRCIGYGILVGVAAQIYIIFRINRRLKVSITRGATV
jgi:hypothetical protein